MIARRLVSRGRWAQALAELVDLRRRVTEAEAVLQAIRQDEVDALVVTKRERGSEEVLTLGAAHLPYAHLIDAMPDGAITLSVDGIVLSVNRRFAELAGKHDLVGTNVVDVVEDESVVRTLLQNVRDAPMSFRARLRGPDGAYVDVDLLASVLPIPGPRRIGVVVSGQRPAPPSGVSERSPGLRHAGLSSPLGDLLKHVSVGVVWVEAQTGAILSFNPRAEQILGWHLTQTEGPSSEATAWRPDGTIVEPVRSLVERVLQQDETVRDELACLRDDGAVVNTRAVATPVRDCEGRIASVVLTIDDAAVEWQAHMDHANAEQLREQFIGVLGHDLRVPLTSVVGGAQLLLSRGVSPQDRRVVERIASSGQRMVRMVEQILDFARGRGGAGFRLERRPASMHEIVRNVLIDFEGPSQTKRIEVAFDGDGKGNWDTDRLGQVIANLVDNARTHGAPGGKIRLSVRDEESAVRVEVHNEGVPIPEGVLATIFEPFRKARVESTPGLGLGLGLYIAREIVHAHGGTLTVVSTPTGGTTFIAVLPRGGPAAE